MFNLPKKKKLFTLNKSPNVNKTSREQFELISYKTVIFIQVLKSMSMPLKYIFSNLPKTVSLKIQKIYFNNLCHGQNEKVLLAKY